MWNFFWFTVILGFFKFIHGVFIKKEVSKLETFALIYSVVLFIILLVFEPDKPETVKPYQTKPIETHQNTDFKKIQEKDKKWRESLGTGVLDDN